jgi:HNH endonuclease
LLAALRAAAHVHLGFGTFTEYVERMLGYSPRSTHEKLRVAQALENLPALSHALDEGTLSWSALRELTRVASADTEQEWLELSRGKSVRQLEDIVAHTRPGDGPDSPRTPGPRRHVLRFEVAPETLALFREASAHLRRHADHAFDDDALLLTMARAVFGGPSDEGRATYQVALTICSECGRAEQRANGTLIEVGSEIATMASCDAQLTGDVDSIDIANVAAPANDNPRAATDDTAYPDPDLAPNPVHSRAPSATPEIDARRGTAPLKAHVSARARQTIPPAVRRAVLQRDHHRCCVPGCKNATFLDLHHIQPRSQGGSNDPENLRTVCGAHHRAVHRGQLITERDASGLRFLHADGRPYGDIGAPTRDVKTTHGEDPVSENKVASALRNLGFRNPDVRAVLVELRKERSKRTTADGAPRVMTTEHLLREALVRLGPERSVRR